jgi:esterase/lipase superfamily enzyme
VFREARRFIVGNGGFKTVSGSPSKKQLAKLDDYHLIRSPKSMQHVASVPGALPRMACVLVTLALAGCAGSKPYQIPFMTPPAFLDSSKVAPFTDASPVATPSDPLILYATLREPATVEGEDRFYTADRAAELRLGEGRIVLGRDDISWDEARQLSLLKDNNDRYPLQVAEVREFGILDRTLHPILHKRGTLSPDPVPAVAFSAAVNARLARSRDKDIFIYVHGYRVNFENPLLVAAELWHFLGYDGVFIPFAWPSHRGRFAYFGDTESPARASW